MRREVNGLTFREEKTLEGICMEVHPHDPPLSDRLEYPTQLKVIGQSDTSSVRQGKVVVCGLGAR